MAEQYDRQRPGYPPQLVQDVIACAHSGPGDRVLEVGAGTGQATLLRGAARLDVTAIEPGPEMLAVAVARAARAGLPVDFIAAEPRVGPGAAGAARACVSSCCSPRQLGTGSSPACATSSRREHSPPEAPWHSPVWEGNELREAFDEVYRRIERDHGAKPPGPMNPFGQPREIMMTGNWLGPEFSGQDEFADPQVRLYHHSRPYTADEYVQLIGTHSDHHLLEPRAQAALLQGIRDAIDGQLRDEVPDTALSRPPDLSAGLALS